MSEVFIAFMGLGLITLVQNIIVVNRLDRLERKINALEDNRLDRLEQEINTLKGNADDN